MRTNHTLPPNRRKWKRKESRVGLANGADRGPQEAGPGREAASPGGPEGQNPLLQVLVLRLCSRMEWQQAVSLAIVALTAVLFLREGLLRRKRSVRLCSGCGCSGTAPQGRVSVTYRARKGERPQVITRIQ